MKRNFKMDAKTSTNQAEHTNKLDVFALIILLHLSKHQDEKTQRALYHALTSIDC